jgi:hypothetical protein
MISRPPSMSMRYFFAEYSKKVGIVSSMTVRTFPVAASASSRR